MWFKATAVMGLPRGQWLGRHAPHIESMATSDPCKGTKILHPACHTEHPKEKKKKKKQQQERNPESNYRREVERGTSAQGERGIAEEASGEGRKLKKGP